MNDLIQFVPNDLMLLIPSTYVLGIFLKQANFIKDKYINLFLLLFAIAGSIGLQSWSVTAFLQGIIVAGVATLINQTAKQLGKEE